VNSETNDLGQLVGREIRGWAPAQLPSSDPMLGRYCTVERLVPERHAGHLYEANATDPSDANWTYLTYGPFPSLNTYTAWATEMASSEDPMFFAVLDGSTGQATGVASLLRVSTEDGTIEVGHINFSPLLQRTRASTEAMYLMMTRVFDDWGYRRYEWKCNSLNAPSMAAARRLGFTYEGTHRQAKVSKGRNRDTAWFSIIDAEWATIKQRLQAWLDPSNFDESGLQRSALARTASD